MVIIDLSRNNIWPCLTPFLRDYNGQEGEMEKFIVADDDDVDSQQLVETQRKPIRKHTAAIILWFLSLIAYIGSVIWTRPIKEPDGFKVNHNLKPQFKPTKRSLCLIWSLVRNKNLFQCWKHWSSCPANSFCHCLSCICSFDRLFGWQIE